MNFTVKYISTLLMLLGIIAVGVVFEIVVFLLFGSYLLAIMPLIMIFAYLLTKE